jgi:hypothetical protein
MTIEMEVPMRQILTVLIFLVAVAVFSSGRSTAEDPKKAEPKTENQLVGTWKLAKAKYGGKEAQIPEGRTEFKRVTLAHFMLVAFDKNGMVIAAIGGPYTVKGEKY